MLIQVECEFVLSYKEAAAVVLMMELHPSVIPAIRGSEVLSTSPALPLATYTDVYGNRCSRAWVGAGPTTFSHRATVESNGLADPQSWTVRHHPVWELPHEALLFLMPSRYCEVDSPLKDMAWAKFGHLPAGWSLVRAVCDFVHDHVKFDYLQARATRTAVEVHRERVGVCRDYAHLAITLCRCLNVPARYCTGYLGDIGVPQDPAPMDVSAWFEVYLGGAWHTFDARHNVPRIGRVLIARGRDAADVAMTTSFGLTHLDSFRVVTHEVSA